MIVIGLEQVYNYTAKCVFLTKELVEKLYRINTGCSSRDRIKI